MSQMALALIILAITIVLFITEPVPIVVTAIGASIAYAYTGIIEVKDIFSGYNSTTIVLLAGMMVVGSSLFHTGITDIIGEKMVKVTGKSERNIILATLIVSCALSSICSNIGVMTAMAPLVTAMCISAGVGPSKALLGLLFGAQFGGFITLVGVGSNASAANAMAELGLTPFGFFGITPYGLGVSILGTLYFTFIGSRLIPDTGYVPEFAKAEKKEFNKTKAGRSAGGHRHEPEGCSHARGSCCRRPGHRRREVHDRQGSHRSHRLELHDARRLPDRHLHRCEELRRGRCSRRHDPEGPRRQPQHVHDHHHHLLRGSLPHPGHVQHPDHPSVHAHRRLHRGSHRREPLPDLTLAGAASYATPFAAPQNMMTVGWTQYKFLDFLKIGIPMLLVTYIVIIAVTPFYLPY